MDTAAELVRTARVRRRLTQKELAVLSGVSTATVSRIEAGKVDPAFGTVVTLLRTLGYRPGVDLAQEADDRQIAAAILSNPALYDRFDVYRVAAQVSPVVARLGARAVTADIDEVRRTLERAQVPYAFSALEGFYGRWPAGRPGSFWPVIYVDPGFEQPWPPQPVAGIRGTVYLLPMTANAALFTERVNATQVMSPDWSIIDTIASPNRQSDVGLDLLAAALDGERRAVA